MSTKNTRSGGKYCGSHTTVIPVATTILDEIHELSGIKQINLGYITSGLKSVHGQKRIKLTDCSGGLQLSVRDNTTFQEFKVYYAKEAKEQDVKLAIARIIRNNDLHLSFGRHADSF